ncbi:MAG TPA: polysaccharide deacetylase family protein [Candidatus Nanoarchaeia archaeon]|nr:polysaccharide deacetylase family protein [Candidatus Nanoarchaeia archaeon]
MPENRLKPEIVLICGIGILIALLFVNLDQKEHPKQERTVIISFDTEFPFGVGFPGDMTANEALMYTPREESWLATMRDLVDLALEEGVAFQFNVVGLTAQRYPRVIRSLQESEMGISCHSFSHRLQANLSNQEMTEEASKCKKTVEEVIGKPVVGNRFPYTNYTDDSFKILVEEGYTWDSSVWSSELDPYWVDGLLELPINPVPNDWGWFVLQRNNNSNAFFKAVKDSLEASEGTYTILLHPWVLSLQREENIQNLRELLRYAKQNNIRVKTGDQVYEEYLSKNT